VILLGASFPTKAHEEPESPKKEQGVLLKIQVLEEIEPTSATFRVRLRLCNQTTAPVYVGPRLGQFCGLVIDAIALPDGAHETLFAHFNRFLPGGTWSQQDFFPLQPGRPLLRDFVLPASPQLQAQKRWSCSIVLGPAVGTTRPGPAMWRPR
jgi:hypothetical protein